MFFVKNNMMIINLNVVAIVMWSWVGYLMASITSSSCVTLLILIAVSISAR